MCIYTHRQQLCITDTFVSLLLKFASHNLVFSLPLPWTIIVQHLAACRAIRTFPRPPSYRALTQPPPHCFGPWPPLPMSSSSSSHRQRSLSPTVIAHSAAEATLPLPPFEHPANRIARRGAQQKNKPRSASMGRPPEFKAPAPPKFLEQVWLHVSHFYLLCTSSFDLRSMPCRQFFGFVCGNEQAPYETFQGALAAAGEYTGEGSSSGATTTTARPSSSNLRASMDDGLLLPSEHESLLDDSALNESIDEASKVRVVFVILPFYHLLCLRVSFWMHLYSQF